MRPRLVVFSQGTLAADLAAAALVADARFRIAVRAATDADWTLADAAARAGLAGGMDLLARRCRVVWEIASDADDEALWTLAATLAGSLLGPVMPADGSTLVGVRGARARAGDGDLRRRPRRGRRGGARSGRGRRRRSRARSLR